MRYDRKNTNESKKIIAELIEMYARSNSLNFMQAGRIICHDRQYRDMVAEAMGGQYRGKAPNDRTIRRWRDEDNVSLASRWPNATIKALSQDELLYRLLPYLKRNQKSPPTQGKYKLLRQKAVDHYALGYSRAEIVNMLGISKATAYRWFPKPQA